MRPCKRTLLVPACAENVSGPAMTERVQRRLFLFFLVCATQDFPTLRPRAGSVNLKLTLADSLRPKENVVPSGSLFFLALMWASALPSRQVFAVSLRLLRIGASRGATTGAAPTGAAPTVIDAVTTAAVPWLLDAS